MTGLMDKVGEMHDCITDCVPQQHKDATNGQFQLGRRFLTEEYLLEERWDQFIYQNKMVIIECQNHVNYWESIKWLLEYTEEYARHRRKATEHGKDSHAAFTSDDGLKTACLSCAHSLNVSPMAIDSILPYID